MEIEIKTLVEIIIVVLTLKLIVVRWKPPMQESVQAIIAITLGTIVGIIINPTVEGFVAGMIASGVAFYGSELIGEFKTIKEELEDMNKK